MAHSRPEFVDDRPEGSRVSGDTRGTIRTTDSAPHLSLGDWTDTFGNGLPAGLDEAAQSEIKADAEAAAAPMLRRRDGTWILDYVRLRFVAIKPAALLK